MTYVLDGVRHGFLGPITWGPTWPALVATVGMVAALGSLAGWGMRRTGR